MPKARHLMEKFNCSNSTEQLPRAGDVAAVDNHGGKPLPLVAPVAKREGAYVARVIRSRLVHQAEPRSQDIKGDMMEKRCEPFRFSPG
jgi:NADH dehydrogenase FAD-containing subunit